MEDQRAGCCCVFHLMKCASKRKKLRTVPLPLAHQLPVRPQLLLGWSREGRWMDVKKRFRSGVRCHPSRLPVIPSDGQNSPCRWYRPSVQSSALATVTTTVPAEPSNPERKARRQKCTAGYSDKCGSPDGTMNASTPRLASSSRTCPSAATRCAVVAPAMVEAAAEVVLVLTAAARGAPRRRRGRGKGPLLGWGVIEADREIGIRSIDRSHGLTLLQAIRDSPPAVAGAAANDAAGHGGQAPHGGGKLKHRRAQETHHRGGGGRSMAARVGCPPPDSGSSGGGRRAAQHGSGRGPQQQEELEKQGQAERRCR